jgi:Na+/H+ antiporter NhaB
MPQPYNLTGLSSKNTLVSLLQESNTIAGGIIGGLILLAVFIISFIAFKDYEGKRAFAGASFLTALIAVFLRVLAMIPDSYMFTTFIIAGISIVALRFGD